MKKILSIFLCVTFIFVMSGCKNSTTQNAPVACQTTSPQKSINQRAAEIVDS
uniref:hypothetical protein n=1 Tax=Acetivibrio cellulolyticus TaxID=35830 RepID=UPI0002EF4B74|nr:hypothetical protein [Acetivibrio cellulolyticus]